MSDELVRQLRNSKGWPTLGNAAADRIEQLTAERDGLLRCVTDNHVALCRAEKAKADGRRLLAIAQDDRVRLLIQLEQCEDRDE